MSDRIEAAPDVRDLVEHLNRRVYDIDKEAATALTTLSTKCAGLTAERNEARGVADSWHLRWETMARQCAEQAAEIERLTGAVAAEHARYESAATDRAMAEADNARLRQREAVLVACGMFFRDMFSKCVVDGGSLDGGDAQEAMEKLGLIELRPTDPATNEYGADQMYFMREEVKAALSSIRDGKGEDGHAP